MERIDDNGFVTVTVNPEVSFISERVPTDASNPSEFGTEIASRKVESGRIRLRDGQTLIISGIIQEQERTTVSKVPLLGDLPIIGSLFRSSTNENEHTRYAQKHRQDIGPVYVVRSVKSAVSMICKN